MLDGLREHWKSASLADRLKISAAWNQIVERQRILLDDPLPRSESLRQPKSIEIPRLMIDAVTLEGPAAPISPAEPPPVASNDTAKEEPPEEPEQDGLKVDSSRVDAEVSGSESGEIGETRHFSEESAVAAAPPQPPPGRRIPMI